MKLKFSTIMIITPLFTSILSSPAIAASNHCGGLTSFGNPFPCCDNNNNGSLKNPVDGNCTWFVWKQANEVWGYKLPTTMYGDAKTWNDKDHAINKPDGHVFSSQPRMNTIAVSENGEDGHVAWVSRVFSHLGKMVIKEQNCNSSSQNPDGKLTNINSFTSYITGLRIEGFTATKKTYADPNGDYQNVNISASFRVKNVTKERIKIRELALAVHDSNGKIKFNMLKPWQGPEEYAIFNKDEIGVSSDGALEAYSVTNFVKAKGFITEKGNYKIVAKIRMWDGEWIEAGYYDLEAL